MLVLRSEPPAHGRHPPEDRALRRHPDRTRSSRPLTPATSTRCRSTSRPRASRGWSASGSGCDAPPPDLTDWRRLVDRIGACEGRVRIALVGKYVQLHDAYLSVAEALKHAGHPPRRRARDRLGRRRGARPARRCSGGPTASSCRAASAGAASRARSRPPATPARTRRPVPRHLPGHADRGHRVRAARLRHGRRQLQRVRPRDALPGHRPAARAARDRGARAAPCGSAPTRSTSSPGTRARAGLRRPGRHLRAPPPPLRGQPAYARRARGRRASSSAAGRPDGRLVEIVELPDHPWFCAVQFHPEFKSRPDPPAAALPRVRRRRGGARPAPAAAARSASRPRSAGERGRSGRAAARWPG